MMPVTQDTLTQIKGSRMEAIFSGRWDKSLPRDDDGRVLLDINTKCFLAVVDYLNECKIAPQGCSPNIPQVREEDENILQQLLLVLGLRDDHMKKPKILLFGKMRLETSDDGSNDNYKASKDKWKVIKFDHL